MTQISKKLERVQLTDIQVELIMPEKVLNQIKYLCRDIAKVEWSGVLFYSMVGSIEDPENLVLTLEDILPMHKGTATYTEYEFDDSVVEFMMDNETMEKGWKMGHIHSHNTMGVFFSGTDWSELEDNAPNHNFYLSLIVNNFMDFCAKVCFIAEAEDKREVNFYSRNERGERYIHSSSEYAYAEQQLVSYDCAIQTPFTPVDVDDEFKSRVEAIIKKADRPAYTPAVRTYAAGYTPTFKNSREDSEERRSWGFMGFQQGAKVKEEKKVEKEDESVEAFALFVVNTGNDTSQYNDIEHVLDYYKQFGLSGKSLATSILNKYVQLYDRFFFHTSVIQTEEKFVEITEELIEELEKEVYLAVNKDYVSAMLQPTIEGLERLLVNFSMLNKDNI